MKLHLPAVFRETFRKPIRHPFFLPILFPFCLLIACAGTASQSSDPFAGWYLGTDKTVKITPAGSGKYVVRIREKNGRESMLEAESSEGRLSSERAGGFAIIAEGGSAYTMGGPGHEERIERTDSVHFVQWWRAAGDSTAGETEEFTEP
jgi:hypothetical protein